MHRAIFVLTLPIATGCVSAHDETPSTLERRSDGQYLLAARIESYGTTPSSVTAAVGSSTYPMSNVGGGRWEATAALGSCAKAFQVRYEVQYPQPVGSGSATLVEPPGASATVGGLLKQVTPDPKLGSCGARSIFRVNDPRFLRDFDTADGVCNANAPGAGAALCTLQAAIEQSNADTGATTIELPAGTYAAPDYFTPRSDVVIAGIEPGVVISTHVSIFLSGGTGTPPTVELRDLTLHGGVRSDSGSLRLVRVNVLNGHPFLVDAGVMALGLLDIEDSTITGNGTVGVRLTGTRGRIRSSLIANNGTDGGIDCAPRPGVSSDLEIFNSTITGNRRRFGGVAVRNRCRATLRNATITGNETSSPLPGARSSGGLSIETGATVILANTILADNVSTLDPANADCAAAASSGSVTVQSLGHNLVRSSASCTFNAALGRPNLLGMSAGLAALANNGGPTRSMLPTPGSAALGAGSPDPYSDAFTGSCTHTDQRGSTRSGACDIGAVQASP